DDAGKKHYWRVPLESGAEPEEVDFQGQKVQGKEKPESSTQISLEAYGSAFDPPVKWADMTPQQKAYYPSWKAMQGLLTTTHQRVQMVTQRNGDTLPVIVEDTTERGNLSGVPKPPGLGGGSAPTSKPPGQQKKDLAAITDKSKPKGAGVVSVGDKPIGGKNTAPQNKADTEYNEAVSLASIADQVAKKPDDAVNIKGFAIALERARAGRFTTQALDVMLDAGWGNKLEQWANKPTSGSLPSDII